MKVGDVIEYTVTIANTGNVAVDVSETDVFASSTASQIAMSSTSDKVSYDAESGAIEVTGLAVGETVTLTGSYTVAAADASVSNAIKDGDTIDVTVEDNPDMVVTKTAETTSFSKVGDVVKWTITVENTGNVTIKNINVEDSLEPDVTFPEGRAIASLAPGESKGIPVEYTVTQADLDAGKVSNAASATGVDPDDDPVTDETDDPSDIPADKDAHMTVAKTSSAAGSTVALGDTITYTVKVTNDGNVTITNIVVNDPMTGDSWTIDSLAPGAEQSFTATYTVTQSDIDNGSVTNTATATGEDPQGDEPDVTPGTVTDTTTDPTPTPPGPGPDPEPEPDPGPSPDPGPTPTPGDDTPTPTPAPGGDTPTPTPTPATATPTPTTGTGAGTTPIANNPTPTTDTIEDDATALGSGGAWSLFDLLCTILTAVLAIIMLIGMIGRKRKEGDEDEYAGDGQEPDQITKRRRLLKGISVIPAIGAIVLFILTQDLTQPMVFFDQWSLVFAIIAIVNIVLRVASIRRKTDDGGDDQQQTGYVPASI